MKRREGEACCRKYIHIFQTSIFLNLEKIAGKLNLLESKGSEGPKCSQAALIPKHRDYLMTATLQRPLNTTVKCRSTECFSELELVTSNCFSHFASGCSSDPSATAFLKHTHTEGQVISKMGKLNKRFPADQNTYPPLPLHMKTKVCPTPRDKSAA